MCVEKAMAASCGNIADACVSALFSPNGDEAHFSLFSSILVASKKGARVRPKWKNVWKSSYLAVVIPEMLKGGN